MLAIYERMYICTQNIHTIHTPTKTYVYIYIYMCLHANRLCVEQIILELHELMAFTRCIANQHEHMCRLRSNIRTCVLECCIHAFDNDVLAPPPAPLDCIYRNNCRIEKTRYTPSLRKMMHLADKKMWLAATSFFPGTPHASLDCMTLIPHPFRRNGIAQPWYQHCNLHCSGWRMRCNILWLDGNDFHSILH